MKETIQLFYNRQKDEIELRQGRFFLKLAQSDAREFIERLDAMTDTIAREKFNKSLAGLQSSICGRRAAKGRQKRG